MRGWLIGLFGVMACHRSARMADPHEAATGSKPEAPSAVAPANPGREAGGDAIDALVRRLASDPLWKNGLAPTIDLPRSAPTLQVVAKALGGFTQGKPFRIIANRAVRIDGATEAYQAVWVETGVGGKIVLLAYESTGWWSRIFDRLPP